MEELWLQGAFMLGMGAVGLIGLGINRLVKGAPEKPPPLRRLADARSGEFIAVIGRVVGTASLRAPITGRACVCFDAAMKLMGKHGYQPHDRLLRGAPFVIDDDSGQALVDPRGAYVRLASDHSRFVSTREHLTSHDAFVLPRYHRDRLYTEAVLRPGDQVVVHGLLRDETGAADDTLYRAAEPVRLQLVGGPRRSAVVSTLPADLPER